MTTSLIICEPTQELVYSQLEQEAELVVDPKNSMAAKFKFTARMMKAFLAK